MKSDKETVHELAVIFCYYKNDEVTHRNLEVLKEHNPDVPVILISSGGETIPGSLNSENMFKGDWKPYAHHSPYMKLRHLRYLWHIFRNGPPREYFWWEADLPLYLAYDAAQTHVRAKRYLFMEWDCYCNIDLREFYKEVWDADLAAQHVFSLKENTDWFVAKRSYQCPPKAQASLYGTAPLAGILLSDRALAAMCNELKADISWRETYCELRVATLAKWLDMELKQLPEHKRKFLRATPPFWNFSEVNEPAVWHMVKN